jgi:hypothetical protein
MNRFLLLLMVSFLALPGFAADIELTGMLRTYTGVRFEAGDIPVGEQTVDLGIRGWGDKTMVKINPYGYISHSGELELGVREAYIDLFLPSLDLRIGKQAIVWGQAEGAFITDIVSPQELRSFILADFREVRMGIGAVKADYFAGPFTIQGVWIPWFVPTKQPEADSIWYNNPLGVVPGSFILPEKSVENSEIFGRISYFGSALNAELMAGYAWDDLPVLSGTVNPADPSLLEASYQRYTVAGGSFSTTLGSTVLRAEAAAYLDRTFTRMESTGPPPVLGTSRHHELQALAGLDRSLFGVAFSGQYIFQYIHNWDSSLMTDEYRHTATFRVRNSFASDTLTLQLFGYFGFDPFDLLLRPSLTWSLEDGVELETGAELFLGDGEGKFGTYSDNSMAYISLRWYF